MNFSKLLTALVTIGTVMAVGAFAWWAYSFNFQFDALNCFLQKSGFCTFKKYDPIVLYIGVGFLSLGLILKYSMSEGNLGTVNNESIQENTPVNQSSTNINEQQVNGSILIFSKLFRRLLIICGVMYSIAMIARINSIITLTNSEPDISLGFDSYLWMMESLLMAIFFFMFFANTSNKES